MAQCPRDIWVEKKKYRMTKATERMSRGRKSLTCFDLFGQRQLPDDEYSLEARSRLIASLP